MTLQTHCAAQRGSVPEAAPEATPEATPEAVPVAAPTSATALRPPTPLRLLAGEAVRLGLPAGTRIVVLTGDVTLRVHDASLDWLRAEHRGGPMAIDRLMPHLQLHAGSQHVTHARSDIVLRAMQGATPAATQIVVQWPPAGPLVRWWGAVTAWRAWWSARLSARLPALAPRRPEGR